MQAVTLGVLSGLVLGRVIVSCAGVDPGIEDGDDPDTDQSGIGGGEPDKAARRRFAFTQSSSAREPQIAAMQPTEQVLPM
jgi:hypothetical protein